jgi:hypothetical protein
MEDETTDETFEYMLHHDLLDGDRIKHFSVHHMSRYDPYFISCSLDGIQSVLIAWMKQEGERLRQRDHWNVTPCNKRFGRGHLVLEYDTLFHYQSSEYRLRLDNWCVYRYCCCSVDRMECIDCGDSEDEEQLDPTVHFELIKVQEPIKEIPLVIKKEPQEHHVLSEEFKAIPCEPVLEWDAEL